MAKKRKKYKDVSLDDIRREVKKLDFPSITHYEWEEDGKKYSSWKINTGSSIINTGDGGMKLFMDALKKKGLEG